MPKKKLTGFDDMWSAYPNPGESAAAAKKTIGGNVDADWITNTCVVRISRAFNYSGHPIPRNRKGLLTVRGGDDLRYALRVNELTRYLKARYGRPLLTHSYSNAGGDIPEAFFGQRGVICFKVKAWTDATGHVDLWNGEECVHAAYFNRADKVMLWAVDADETPGARSPRLVHKISGSVGEGGVNKKKDIAVVQVLLRLAGVEPGRVDGVMTDDTIDAITTFQMRFLRRPDGRVDVDGRTWRELNAL